MATNWKIDNVHSYIGFRITMLGIAGIRGHFNGYKGTVLKPNEDNWDAAEVYIEISISSIDTANKSRDEHLQEEYFFYSANYPVASFVSTGFKKGDGENKYLVTGNFTMKGITKPIELQAVFGGLAKDREGNEKAGFSASAKISREDFGIAPHALLPDGSIFLNKEMEIQIDVQLIK